MSKKKRFLFILMSAILMLSFIIFLGCEPGGGGDNGNKGSSEIPSTPAPALADGYIRIYYMDDVPSGTTAGLWMWAGVKVNSDQRAPWPNGSYAFDKRDSNTDGHYYMDVEMSSINDTLQFTLLTNIPGGDDAKDGAGDRAYQFASAWATIYLWSGDAQSYISVSKEVPIGVTSGEIINESTIEFNSVGITASSLLVDDFKLTDKGGVEVQILSITKKASNVYTLSATLDPVDKAPYTLTYRNRDISIGIASKYIDNKYTYTGNDLGVTYNGTDATFKVWAPKATSVKVVIYKANDQKTQAGSDVDLTHDTPSDWKGVWTKTVAPGDVGETTLNKCFYQYRITNLINGVPTTALALDPYAKSMAAFYVESDGTVKTDAPDKDLVGKGAIINLSNTGTVTALQTVSGYGMDGYSQREDAIIYEVHMRDFTSYWGMDGSINSVDTGISTMSKPTDTLGTYKAFIHNLDYIKEMGYTHVQLLPVMNFYFGNEANKEIDTRLSTSSNFNWGYDPHHYFSPEGMYASDATDPEARVKELKELITEIHNRGMGVILDNVYNHNAKQSLLHDLVPDYYMFMKNGVYVSAYGGGKLASNHVMVRKMIIDSIKYWFTEYKIDGMRWDLMGEVDSVTVKTAYDEAHAINGKALFIGEGWSGNSIDDASLVGADQAAMNEINDGADDYGRAGAFSDEFRNLMKSGYGSEGTPRFISGGKVSTINVFKNVRGRPSNFNAGPKSKPTQNSTNDPGQAVQYIEAHDNMTVHDIIAWHTKIDPRVAGDGQTTIHKRIRLGNFMVLTSQGIAFMHAGQEFGRTKIYGDGNTKPADKWTLAEFTTPSVSSAYFIHDSYDSSDRINQLDWSLMVSGKPGRDTAAYTKGLIELRKSTNAFRQGTLTAIDSNIVKIKFVNENFVSDAVLGYKSIGSDATYYVFINCDTVVRTVDPGVDITSGEVLVDGATAGKTPISSVTGVNITASLVTLQPLTATVIKMP